MRALPDLFCIVEVEAVELASISVTLVVGSVRALERHGIVGFDGFYTFIYLVHPVG